MIGRWTLAPFLAVWLAIGPAAKAQVAKPEDIALANAEYLFWHQVSAALAHQHGRQPDPWLAAVHALGRVGEGDAAVDIERLLFIAETWLIAGEDGPLPKGLREVGIDAELARKVLCYVAGEGPGRAHALIGKWGDPVTSLDCASELTADFATADESYREYPPGQGDKVRIKYGTGRWAAMAADHEMLEGLADTLSADFDWPGGLALEIIPCGGVFSWYTAESVTITLCAETIAYFHRLADGRVGY